MRRFSVQSRELHPQSSKVRKRRTGMVREPLLN